MLNCLPAAESGLSDGRAKLAAFIYDKQSDVKQSCACTLSHRVSMEIPALNSQQATKVIKIK